MTEIQEIQEIQGLIEQTDTLLTSIATKKEIREGVLNRVAEVKGISDDLQKREGVYNRASTILGTVADENTEQKLNAIMSVINRALALLFPESPRQVTIKPTMYRNTYPHFNVILTVEDGKQRTFKQSGTGLAQVVSFLCTACLIDAREGRKIMVMDELLNGLHPTAKGIIKDLMLALSNRFQFIIVEYGLDFDNEWEVVKKGDTSTIRPTSHYFGNYEEDEM